MASGGHAAMLRLMAQQSRALALAMADEHARQRETLCRLLCQPAACRGARGCVDVQELEAAAPIEAKKVGELRAPAVGEHSLSPRSAADVVAEAPQEGTEESAGERSMPSDEVGRSAAQEVQEQVAESTL